MDRISYNVKFIGYDRTRPNDKENTDKFVHFFLDDYKFEVLWNNPEPRISKLRQYRGILSPQYSIYTEMPQALQIYNTFRSRWCGAYFQSKGLNVIPTVSWGGIESFHYCFDGIAEGSVVAVSTLGVRTEKEMFLRGYNQMLERIKPRAVICYCDPFAEMDGNIITVDYRETNNLAKIEQAPKPQIIPQGGDKVYVRFYAPFAMVSGRNTFDKGMGSAYGGGLKLDETELDNLQATLDVIGFVPVVGEFADGLNAGIYVVRGDLLNAGLSAAGMLPIAGRASTGGRLTGQALTNANNLIRGAGKFDIADSIQKRLRICEDFFRQVPIFRFSNAVCIRGSGSGCMAEKRPQRPVGFG